jgi:hypothetical protein
VAYPIAAGWRTRLFWLMLLLTIAVAWIMRRPLTTPVTPGGILDLELAGAPERVREILAAWDASGVRDDAISNVQIDFVWLLLYSTTISLGCVLTAARLHERGWTRAGALGLALAWGQWLAALLDAVENVAMLRLLQGSVAQPWPTIARACAIPKFALVVAGIAYVALGLLALGLHRAPRSSASAS